MAGRVQLAKRGLGSVRASGEAYGKSGYFPHTLNLPYLLAGVLSLSVFLLPDMEVNVLVSGVVISIWQGFSLSKTEPCELR